MSDNGTGRPAKQPSKCLGNSRNFWQNTVCGKQLLHANAILNHQDN